MTVGPHGVGWRLLRRAVWVIAALCCVVLGLLVVLRVAHAADAPPDLTPLYGVGGLPVGVVVAVALWRWVAPYLPARRASPSSDPEHEPLEARLIVLEQRAPAIARMDERLGEVEAAVLPRRGTPLDERVAVHDRELQALAARQDATDTGMARAADLIDRILTSLPTRPEP